MDTSWPTTGRLPDGYMRVSRIPAPLVYSDATLRFESYSFHGLAFTSAWKSANVLPNKTGAIISVKF